MQERRRVLLSSGKKGYSNEYLTFTAIENCIFQFSGNNSINYSLDNGTTWTSLAADTDSPTVSAGNKILWKEILTPTYAGGIGTFSSTGRFTVEGNVMSLLYGDDFVGQTSLSGKAYAFYNLFHDCSFLTSAENLSLPATTLSNSCYMQMFYQCINLTIAPELPATTLEYYCYSNMFFGCTNLTIAPKLPALNLANSCYDGMFSGCTALTTAPELPATTLANYCYNDMFDGCTALTTAPELPATTLAESCYRRMFLSCTTLTTAPELPATKLVNSCYAYMFNNCRRLNSITCLATNISATWCTTGWLVNVAASGTFTKAASMSSWTTGVSGIPSGWTVQNA